MFKTRKIVDYFLIKNTYLYTFYW